MKTIIKCAVVLASVFVSSGPSFSQQPESTARALGDCGRVCGPAGCTPKPFCPQIVPKDGVMENHFVLSEEELRALLKQPNETAK
jgi:hypothetical protein